MSAKASTANTASGRIDTLIGAGMHVAGNVSCTGVVRVQGSIAGHVACDGSAQSALVVDNAGSVCGPAVASHVIVRGKIDGPVHAGQTMEVHEGGSVTGDVTFSELAIHAGGIVDGVLVPLHTATADLRSEPQDRDALPPAALPPAARAATGPDVARGLGRKALFASVAVVVLAAVAWLARDIPGKPRNGDEPGLRPAASIENGKPQLGEQAQVEPPSATSRAPASALPSAPAGAEEARQSDRPTAGNEKQTVIHGANASRPANVFLLVASEPTVLYRKKQDDPGEGARITVSQGERVSVGIAAGEVIRVAKGAEAVIFYQGKKVPPEVISAGTWIRFVPR